MLKDTLACLGFSLFVGIGPHYFQKLIQKFKTPSQVFQADTEELRPILSTKLLAKFLEFRQQFDPEKERRKLLKDDISYVACIERQYPKLLKEISDPPIGLFYRGDWLDYDWNKDTCFVIVGTRQPTHYGQKIARQYAQTLAESGLIIVSGLAIGIDACAHQGSLAGLGRTIGVLGCGLKIIYPQENYGLYQQIIKDRGLVISEFPPDLTTAKGHFVSRNRIISGLSRGVLIIEGSKKSGTLITARYAAEQGREVFALPGQVGSENAQAPLLLLKQGAHLVTSPNDILEVLNLSKKDMKKEQNVELGDFSKSQQKLIAFLLNEPHFFEELQLKTNLSITQLNQELSHLELEGVVNRSESGQWQTDL